MSAGALRPLEDAADPEAFGGKSAQLSEALRAGLPVPSGYALDWTSVNAFVSGDSSALTDVLAVADACPWAVRSSAIGEDSEDASFAGTHVSVLGVVGPEALRNAVHQVFDSALDENAAEYRRQRGLDPAPRMAVVLQKMVAADVAGVMFTRNPVSGADERVIEASWGLGEMVVSGRVTPDQYRLAPDDGHLIERWPGEKDLALHLQADGTVAESEITGELVERCCLDGSQLEELHDLATHCDEVFGSTAHDIEFAFAADRLHLLQRRPITHG
ncbi:PEP/pyruvate-binding domain-containing protein [Nocardioides marmorisolisilvae]|uniref:Pyruvate phosphate dikinase AMP/ATP-binding domain-containing protein n=1 Tax=Nocardioides marmorisolisilvae TaxID=1542737 RepID=A0A3N0DTL7_9ACTN|nr:PEP/pyruvate-binding domain-containing protein [Nocardioides marmorisolisilvae]RNL78836.1 hypothetical protein EFL95_07160 [Nocardioides marmorisolisilvae]